MGGEEMFCERKNSCLARKKEKEGWVGPLTAFWTCVDMSTGNSYAITSYIRSKDNSNLKEKVYCKEKFDRNIDSRTIGHTGENPTNPMIDIETIDSSTIECPQYLGESSLTKCQQDKKETECSEDCKQ